MRILIAGGGTGGHVIPALAIGRELQSRFGAEVVFVGTARGIENRLVPAAGFRLELVNVGALKNVGPITLLRTVVDLPRAVLAASRLLGRFRPDAVIGVGGYASGPAMLAAALRRTPMLAFEPNLVPGFANRAVARFVNAAAVQFEETARYFPHAQVTGVPVRPEFFSLPSPSPPSETPPTLLVTGGSQGASAINRAVTAALPAMKQRLPQLRIIHQTGERDHKEVEQAYAASGMSAAAEVTPFIADMPAAFARAHLLICRSGASTVAEVAAAGKVAIFIPFPLAADDHQRRNAEALEQRDAAALMPQSELTPERLSELVLTLLGDRSRMERMATAARGLAHPDATVRIADMVAGIIR